MELKNPFLKSVESQGDHDVKHTKAYFGKKRGANSPEGKEKTRLRLEKFNAFQRKKKKKK